MSEPTETTFYAVRVRLREVKAFDGSVMTKAGTEKWLGMEDHYPTIGGRLHPFTAPPTKSEVAKWDRMPWYNVIDTAEVVKITERRLYEKFEEPIGPPL